MGKYSSPLFQDPLTQSMRIEMTIVTVAACISFVTTVALIIYLSHLGVLALRTKERVPQHFYSLFLVFNLLIGNAIESLAFSLDLVYLIMDEVSLGPMCTAQGMILQVGDMLGSAFTTAIALQTFCILIFRKNTSKRVFYGLILFVWFFSIFLGAPMPAIDSHFKPGLQYYTLAGAWCWISPFLTRERLFTHYVYVFFDQIVCIVLYLWIYVKLRALTKRAASDIGRHHSTEKLESSARKMILYPLVYTLTTMPLAIARVAAMVGIHPSGAIVCFVGTIFSLSGFFNALLYGLTRNIFPDRPSVEKARPIASSRHASSACTTDRLSSIFQSMKRATIDIPRHLLPQDRDELIVKNPNRLSADLLNLEPVSSPDSSNVQSTSIATGSIFVKSETTVISESTVSPTLTHSASVFQQ